MDETKTPVMDLPKEKKQNPFVLQEHIRGNTAHRDIRFSVNNHLIGFTLDDPGKVGDPVRFTNEPTEEKTLAQLKERQPMELLKLSGEIAPGDAGAPRLLPVKFKIIDSGLYEMGAQKPDFLEVFLEGKEYKGRYVFEKLPIQKERAGNKSSEWFAWKPLDQNPYVLSEGSVQEKFTPAMGRSALSKVWETRIPAELKWWEKNWTEDRALSAIKTIRQIFLKRNVLTLEQMSFALNKVGDAWQLVFSTGIYYELDANPLAQTKGINAVKKIFSFENISKTERPANAENLDKGKTSIVDSDTNIHHYKFAGSKLKGLWIFKINNENWIMEKPENAAEPKKLSAIQLSAEQVGQIYFSTKGALSLQTIADDVGCSKQAVINWQRKLRLR